jgi:U1 small nuclear ribonucleoprotein C
MVRFYCDYCDSFLTHDSPAVRKQHNSGYKHKSNVKAYYLQLEEAMQEQGHGMGGPPGVSARGERGVQDGEAG